MQAAIKQLQGKCKDVDKYLSTRVPMLQGDIEKLKQIVEDKQRLEERITSLREELPSKRLKLEQSKNAIRVEKGPKGQCTESEAWAFNGSRDRLRIKLLSKQTMGVLETKVDALTRDEKVIKMIDAETENEALGHDRVLYSMDNRDLLDANSQLLNENLELKQQLELQTRMTQDLFLKSEAQGNTIKELTTEFEKRGALSVQKKTQVVDVDPSAHLSEKVSELQHAIIVQDELIKHLERELNVLRGDHTAMFSRQVDLENATSQRWASEQEAMEFLTLCLEDISDSRPNPEARSGTPAAGPTQGIPASERPAVAELLQRWCQVLDRPLDATPGPWLDGKTASQPPCSPLDSSPDNVAPHPEHCPDPWIPPTPPRGNHSDASCRPNMPFCAPILLPPSRGTPFTLQSVGSSPWPAATPLLGPYTQPATPRATSSPQAHSCSPARRPEHLSPSSPVGSPLRLGLTPRSLSNAPPRVHHRPPRAAATGKPPVSMHPLKASRSGAKSREVLKLSPAPVFGPV
mmetsp:Transcript_148437/g.259429  ORF Transcript_148437/g.259429 Transcript_148437/m.259429 type:complete len:518 (-) Transcript_148437:163-1716(-)